MENALRTKKLYIVRHGKAEYPQLGVPDFNRALLEKGVARSVQIAHSLKDLLSPTDRIKLISSTATRAQQTAQLFAQVLDISHSSIVLEPSIYEASYLDILTLINQQDSLDEHIILVGHNPGLSDFVGYITDSIVELKTAHVAIIALEEGIDYAHLSASTAHLQAVIDQ